MFISLKTFVLVVFALSVNGQKRFGSNCRNINCASSQQCLGLYEPCQTGLVDGSSCGHYSTCVDLEGEVKHSERPASSSNVGNDPKPIQRNSTSVSSSDNASNNGQLYPSLPQPDYPSNPQGGSYPPNPQGGSYPPNQQGGYYPPNQQGGFYPPNQQGGYYPPNQQGGYYPSNPQVNPNYPPTPGPDSGNKKDSSDSGSGFSSFLNFLGGNNRGSSSGSSGSPDFGSLLSILGRGGNGGNNSPASGSGSGGLDFSSLLSTFTGSGNRGSGQNTRNDFENRNPTTQNVGPNPPYSGNSGQNPNQAQDSGSNFLQTLGNFASSPLGQQLLVNALRSRGNENDSQQSRRVGGLFSENASKTEQTVPGADPKGYPTQPPYTP